MEILWIWEIVLDKTYIISWDLDFWQKTESQDSQISIWWPVPSALKLLKNLWCSVSIIWSIWNWPLWKFVKNEFKKYGIKSNFVVDKSTKVNTVIVNEINWTRTIIKDKIYNDKLQKIDIEAIKIADLIIFDRSEKEAFKFVLKHKNEDTKIIFDPWTEWNEEIIFMSKNTFFPIFPIETLKKINDKNDFEKNIKKLYKLMWKSIIITAWENWSFLYDWKELRHFQAIKICCVDTNWAWDIFRWAIAYGILQKRDLEKSIIFANKLAWLQCMRKGNLSAVPNLKEINNFTS